MVAKTGLLKCLSLTLLLTLCNVADAQNPLRDTFFRDADAAKAAAEEKMAELASDKFSGMNVETCVVSTTKPVHREIIEFANERISLPANGSFPVNIW